MPQNSILSWKSDLVDAINIVLFAWKVRKTDMLIKGHLLSLFAESSDAL